MPGSIVSRGKIINAIWNRILESEDRDSNQVERWIDDGVGRRILLQTNGLKIVL